MAGNMGQVQSMFGNVQGFLEPLKLNITASYLFGFLAAQILQGELDALKCLNALGHVIKLEEKHRVKLLPVIEPLIAVLHKNLAAAWIELDPMISGAEMPLSARIYTLQEFLQAFIESLGENPERSIDMSEDVQEVYDDFLVLREMDMDAQDGEESEKDFNEITEYVKIGLMLFVEHANFFNQEKLQNTNQVHH